VKSGIGNRATDSFRLAWSRWAIIASSIMGRIKTFYDELGVGTRCHRVSDQARF
jgi:hypothetical protein